MNSRKRVGKNNYCKIRSIVVIAEILLFIVLIFINLVPIIWGVLTSFKPLNVIFNYPPKFIGFSPSLEHYITVEDNGFLRAFLNSVLYSIASMLVGLVLALLAGYGFQRYKFKFKKFLFFLVVAGIPLSMGSSALLIPNYLYLSSLGMINQWFTLIILFTAYNIPMAIWIVGGGMEGIPVEIEEAALIDGCSRSYIIFRIITALNRPALAAAALFIFIGSWNEFIAAMVMVNSDNLRPVQVVIYNFLGYFGQEWGPLTASTTLAIIPTLIVFVFLGKALISGLTQGSVKG